MPIAIRDDVVYIMLKKIHDSDRVPGPDPVNFTETDFTGHGDVNLRDLGAPRLSQSTTIY